MLRKATQVAWTDTTVFLQGESGTGKEVLARFIHHASPRKHGPFVAINCAALPEQLFESELFGYERGAFTGAQQAKAGHIELASAGVLFLDEVSEMSPMAQAKLLRVLQEREFRRLGGRQLVRSDFRLISASNADLSVAARAGRFREDLLHRLKVVHVQLPPLRERREDIPLLVSAFISQKRLRLQRPGVCRVSHPALDVLLSYDWPGNVRELENVIETAILESSGDTIELAHLVFGSGVIAPLPRPEDLDLAFRVARRHALGTFERLYLFAQLRRFKGSIKNAASYAGITTKHLRALMKRHGIHRRDFRPPLRPRRAGMGPKRVTTVDPAPDEDTTSTI